MQKNPLASLPILLLFFFAFKMHKLFNQLVVLAICLVIILVVIYVVSIRIRDVGLARAMIPCVISDIRWYSARMGGLNILDFAKLTAFFIVAYFSFVTCVNKVSEKLFPPSIVAIRADIAITKLVNEKITRVDKDDIRCFQISPRCLTIRHSARATLDWNFYHENERAIETPIGVDFTDFVFLQNSEVLAYFEYGISHKIADILIEQPDNPGNYFVVHGNGGSYIYVYGNHRDYLQCTKFKIGWTEKFDGIEKRGNEGDRWETPHTHLIACMEVENQKVETAIHDRFDHARVYPKNKPGREIFYATDDVKEWVGELIKRQTSKLDS